MSEEESKEEPRGRKLLSLMADAVVVGLAGGCVLTLFLVLWNMGHDIEESLERSYKDTRAIRAELKTIKDQIIDITVGVELENELNRESHPIPKNGGSKDKERAKMEAEIRRRISAEIKRKTEEEKKRGDRQEQQQFQMPF